jgi:hypothetical protein
MNVLPPLLFTLTVPLMFAAAKYMKDLEPRLAEWILVPYAVGAVAGTAFLIADPEASTPLRVGTIALLVALGSFWLFRKEHAPDAFEGLLRGGLLASGFGIPLALGTERPFGAIALALASSLAAGAVASWMSDASSRAGTLASVLAAAGIAAAAAHSAAGIVDPAAMAWSVAIGSALLAAASPFFLFPGVEEELEQESSLGILPRGMVFQVSHPLRRMSRGDLDPAVHRRIIQAAWRLALRRRRHRSMGLEESRLHQVEILKLRRELSLLLRAGDDQSLATEADAARIQSSPKGSPSE